MNNEPNNMIMRFQKLKSVVELHRSLKHCFREQLTPNANSDISHKNEIITSKIGTSVDSVMNRIKGAINRLDKPPRKNAVFAIEVVFTASPEAMKKKSFKERRAYLIDSFRWFAKKVGRDQVLTAVIHRDESGAEHGHFLCLAVPAGSNVLNCREILGGHKNRASELQDEFFELVAKNHGFDRGVKGSRATHQSLRDYNLLVNEQLPKLREEKVQLLVENDRLDKEIKDNRGVLQGIKERIEAEKEELIKMCTYSYHYLKEQLLKRFYILHKGGDEFENLPKVDPKNNDYQIDSEQPALRPWSRRR